MKKDNTHITIILDRSGSMQTIRDDIIGGFNAFLQQQYEVKGSATITLVQFDSTNPYEVIYEMLPIGDVSTLTAETYVPRGGTPLLDAVGRGINDLEASLAKMDEGQRPERTLFVIVTDGMENSSCEFNKVQIEKMIKEKTEKLDWQFVFLSADMNAINEAYGLGIQEDKSLLFQKSPKGSEHAWNTLSERTTEYRHAQRKKMGFNVDDQMEKEEC